MTNDQDFSRPTFEDIINSPHDEEFERLCAEIAAQPKIKMTPAEEEAWIKRMAELLVAIDFASKE